MSNWTTSDDKESQVHLASAEDVDHWNQLLPQACRGEKRLFQHHHQLVVKLALEAMPSKSRGPCSKASLCLTGMGLGCAGREDRVKVGDFV